MNDDLDRNTAEYFRFNIFPFLYTKKNGGRVFGKHPVTLSVLGHNRKQAFDRAKNMAKNNMVLFVPDGP